jgi:hypothetical protein
MVKCSLDKLIHLQWNPHLRFAFGMGCLYLKSGTFLNGGYMKFEEGIVL